MSLQVEQGSLVLETQLANGGLKAEQTALVLETSLPQSKALIVEQSALIIEYPAPGVLVVLNGKFVDCLGNPLVNGYLTLQLSQNAVGRGQINAGIVNTVQLDENGFIAGGGIAVWPNATLLPTTSVYYVDVFNHSGASVFPFTRSMTVPLTPNPNNIANLLT